MRIALLPEGFADLVGYAAGRVPTPMGHTWCAQKLARWIMAAVRTGVFDALETGAQDAATIALRCGLNATATAQFLGVLVSAGYLAFDSGVYSLTQPSRKWLLASGTTSVRDNLLFQYVEWRLLDATEDFLRTGEPIDFHSGLSAEEWQLYQRSMRALAGTNASEVVKNTPLPPGGRAMLDIGGSHGYYSVALCRRHEGLTSTILDLPQAVEHAAPILAREGMGTRVVHRAGDALVEDLGERQYDLIFVSGLVHHFDDETNFALARKCARALRPGGYHAILDFIRHDSPNEGGQLGWLMNFYFAMTSRSGTWSFEEMKRWQRGAGLLPKKSVRLRTMAGYGLQVARRA